MCWSVCVCDSTLNSYGAFEEEAYALMSQPDVLQCGCVFACVSQCGCVCCSGLLVFEEFYHSSGFFHSVSSFGTHRQDCFTGSVCSNEQHQPSETKCFIFLSRLV